jgi:hypothetical protein
MDEEYFCERHNPITDPDRVTKVVLIHNGISTTTYRANKGTFPVENGNISYASAVRKVGPLFMLVNKRDFCLRQTNKPLGVKNLTPAAWPHSLGWLRTVLIEDFYDLCHFIKLGEARTMSLPWWANKFSRDISLKSAERRFQRMRERFIFLNAPVSFEYDIEGKMQMVFDPELFVDGVIKEMARRDAS